MFRRSVALGLWAYFGWYLGALVATAASLPSSFGPVIGVTVAVIAVVDWRRARGSRRESTADAHLRS